MACLSCPPSEVAEVNNSNVIRCKAGTRNNSTALLICQMVCSSSPRGRTAPLPGNAVCRWCQLWGSLGAFNRRFLAGFKDDAEEVDINEETSEEEDDEEGIEEASGPDDDWPW